MKRSTTLPLKILLTLCLFGFGVSSAQQLLTGYEDAAAALRSSIEAFPTDQVESLDALRRAETAFKPLGAVLEPSLRQGLNETFSRAEEAIVNQSETDLQVQAAVLQGGFGRAVYQQALQDAANGELDAARNLLGVLAQDLNFDNAQFEGSSQEALQGAFEARLAARGLAQLGAFGGDLGSRYRTLAQLYGYVFLVQDSPRLPPKTRDTVVGAIRSLVAERPTDEGISLLQAQLTGFARSAERAEAGASSAQTDASRQTPEDSSTTPASTNQTTTAATGTPAGAPTDEPVDAAQGAVTDAAPFVPPVETASPDSMVVDGEQPTFPAPATSSAQPSPAQVGVASGTEPGLVPTLPFLTQEVRALLFAAAGLLALIGLVRLLFAPSLSPWRDAALVLLLLPVILEGLIALAGLLAPLVNQPLLAQAEAYSLFVNPVMQLVWVLLSAAAVLCLAIGWRPATRPERSKTRADKLDEAAPAEREAAYSASSTRSAPLTTGALNWDDDF